MKKWTNIQKSWRLGLEIEMGPHRGCLLHALAKHTERPAALIIIHTRHTVRPNSFMPNSFMEAKGHMLSSGQLLGKHPQQQEKQSDRTEMCQDEKNWEDKEQQGVKAVS